MSNEPERQTIPADDYLAAAEDWLDHRSGKRKLTAERLREVQELARREPVGGSFELGRPESFYDDDDFDDDDDFGPPQSLFVPEPESTPELESIQVATRLPSTKAEPEPPKPSASDADFVEALSDWILDGDGAQKVTGAQMKRFSSIIGKLPPPCGSVELSRAEPFYDYSEPEPEPEPEPIEVQPEPEFEPAAAPERKPLSERWPLSTLSKEEPTAEPEWEHPPNRRLKRQHEFALSMRAQGSSPGSQVEWPTEDQTNPDPLGFSRYDPNHGPGRR